MHVAGQGKGEHHSQTGNGMSSTFAAKWGVSTRSRELPHFKLANLTQSMCFVGGQLQRARAITPIHYLCSTRKGVRTAGSPYGSYRLVH